MRRAVLCVVTLFLPGAMPLEAAYRLGIGRGDITPTEPIWMAGYASRTKPSLPRTCMGRPRAPLRA